ncbi:hypothetical protein KM043_011523 [Ampulex compressa]|nr:hypothetical protein KM043_011523 [Ampulex compressa]
MTSKIKGSNERHHRGHRSVPNVAQNSTRIKQQGAAGGGEFDFQSNDFKEPTNPPTVRAPIERCQAFPNPPSPITASARSFERLQREPGITLKARIIPSFPRKSGPET